MSFYTPLTINGLILANIFGENIYILNLAKSCMFKIYKFQKICLRDRSRETFLPTPSFSTLTHMRCTICYHLYNLKNVKNTHGGVLLLVKLQAEAYNFTKSNTPSWVFFTFLNCANGTKSRNSSPYQNAMVKFYIT